MHFEIPVVSSLSYLDWKVNKNTKDVQTIVFDISGWFGDNENQLYFFYQSLYYSSFKYDIIYDIFYMKSTWYCIVILLNFDRTPASI